MRAEQIDRFVNEAGEIGIARTRIEGELRTLRRSLLDLTENVIRLRNQLREVEIQAEVQMQSRIAQAESHHAEFDPLEMDRYTRLQELTRMMAESVNDVTTVQQTLLHNLDGADLALNGQGRTTRELQQGLMRVRMLPFDSLADRLYRVVRQSAKELGKRASLDLRGGRIEIDRSVLEQMAAPLEHLLRNAVAHGIEGPAERATAGKPETGQIVLTVTQEGNEIAIDLQDDGSGLDFERIAERARRNGLIGPDEHPDTKRLTNLIFLSGFSTAGQLSAVSGRGVGMDVVKAQTASLGGRIDVASTAGQGTHFRIYLPLTLAVTQALLVKASGRNWAIPSNMVAQAMELKADALKRVQDERGIEWQGQRYAHRYLPRLLGDRQSLPEEQRYNWLLLLRAGAQTLALHVDSMRGNQEIVVKNAGPQLTRIVGMTGATVLADGEIALILNPVALASRSLDTGAEADEARIVAEAPPVALHQPTVMVVDDSLTVRRITGRLLEREGYRVITAKDGVDALEQLVDIVPDVVLSDIEMPRMDGFDLVRNIRADARTRQVPVIMITSRLADKHRRYAEEVGANHYLGKPYQEEELLALLAGYTRAETTTV
ncbi:response regulator [Thauera humireducens]|uniref:response regulator n=1 Tax=Thauera humireducens TaxID=1134435 RepID=UPI0031200388